MESPNYWCMGLMPMAEVDGVMGRADRLQVLRWREGKLVSQNKQ
jgi:hypothetical protein